MAIPAYLWLKDDGGTPVKGSVDMPGREGSIEIIGYIAGHSTSKGPMTIILEQTSGDTFGRSAFRIHGERVDKPAGFASEGCIIMSRATRRRILREGGMLEVVR